MSGLLNDAEQFADRIAIEEQGLEPMFLTASIESLVNYLSDEPGFPGMGWGVLAHRADELRNWLAAHQNGQFTADYMLQKMPHFEDEEEAENRLRSALKNFNEAIERLADLVDDD